MTGNSVHVVFACFPLGSIAAFVSLHKINTITVHQPIIEHILWVRHKGTQRTRNEQINQTQHISHFIHSSLKCVSDDLSDQLYCHVYEQVLQCRQRYFRLCCLLCCFFLMMVINCDDAHSRRVNLVVIQP